MHSYYSEYSQQFQADQRNHALHAVRGDLQYHAFQQYLGVRGYQRHPAQGDTSSRFKPDRSVSGRKQKQNVCRITARHSQGHRQRREIPSLQKVLGLQQHQPHQGDQRGRSHHVLLLRHLCRRVRWVRVLRRLPGCVQRIQITRSGHERYIQTGS